MSSGAGNFATAPRAAVGSGRDKHRRGVPKQPHPKKISFAVGVIDLCQSSPRDDGTRVLLDLNFAISTSLARAMVGLVS